MKVDDLSRESVERPRVNQNHRHPLRFYCGKIESIASLPSLIQHDRHSGVLIQMGHDKTAWCNQEKKNEHHVIWQLDPIVSQIGERTHSWYITFTLYFIEHFSCLLGNKYFALIAAVQKFDA